MHNHPKSSPIPIKGNTPGLKPTIKKVTFIQWSYSGNKAHNLNKQNISSFNNLFAEEFIPSFLTRYNENLANDEKLAIKANLIELAQYLKMDIQHSNVLGLLYCLTLNSHLIINLRADQVLKLKQKAFSCMINYHLISLLAQVFIKKNNNLYPEIKDLVSKIHNSFTITFDSTSLVAFELTEKNKDLLFNNSKSLLTTFQRDMFKALQSLQAYYNNMLSEQYSAVTDVLSYDTFTTNFNFISSFVLQKTETNDKGMFLKYFVTDLKVLQHLLSYPVLDTFMSKQLKEKGILINLLTNFQTLVTYYYYYGILQNPWQLIVLMEQLFIKESTSKQIKLSYDELLSLYNRESVSNNLFVSLCSLLTNVTFDLSLFLARNITLNFASYDLNTAQAISEEITKIKETTAIKAKEMVDWMHNDALK